MLLHHLYTKPTIGYYISIRSRNYEENRFVLNDFDDMFSLRSNGGWSIKQL